MCQQMQTRCSSVEQRVETLSGGNQQKVVVSKWLERDADIFLFDEPTRGVDIGARERLYRLFDALSQQGKAIVIVSSDLEELLDHCDTIAVMSAGRLTASFSRSEWTREAIMQAAFAGYLSSGDERGTRPAVLDRNGREMNKTGNKRSLLLTAMRAGGLGGVLLLLIAIFSVTTDNFLSTQTLSVIANQIPDLAVIAVGMTLVLIIGGIDLSVGSVLALTSAVLGVLMVDQGWPLWGAVLASIATGALCGLISGSISVLARIPSFIVTLGMLEVARGLTFMITDSSVKYIGSSVEAIGNPLRGVFLSPAFLLAVGVVIVGQWVLSKTIYGRYCVAMGTNAEAVRMSGINTIPYAISVFVVLGALCGVAGVFQTSRLSSVDPNAAVGLELSAIAACVIGGTSLMGGRGSIVNTFFGVLIIAVLQTGLAQVGASDPSKRVVTGCVIVIAVLLDALRRYWRKSHVE